MADGVFFNAVRHGDAVAAGAYFNAVRFLHAETWYYDGWYYWLGPYVTRVAVCGWPYGDWTDGIYHADYDICGWYTEVLGFTYMGDCDLRTLMGGLYPSAWLGSGGVIHGPYLTYYDQFDPVTANAIANHFFGMSGSLQCTFRVSGTDVTVGGWYQWATAGTVTFGIQAVYRQATDPMIPNPGIFFSGVRMEDG